MSRSARHAGRLLLVAVAAAGCLSVAHQTPSAVELDLTAWRNLLHQQGAAVVAIDIVRHLALATCAYLFAIGSLHTLAALTPFAALRAIASAVTPRALRPFLGVVVVATLSSPALAAPPEDVGPPPTMRRVGPVASTTLAATTTLPTASTAVVPAIEIAVVSPPMPKHAAPADAPPATWTVVRGDHLWSIAQQVMDRTIGRDATEREIAPYWRRLIEANRDRLVDPQNPDLVYVAQVFVLPPVA